MTRWRGRPNRRRHRSLVPSGPRMLTEFLRFDKKSSCARRRLRNRPVIDGQSRPPAAASATTKREGAMGETARTRTARRVGVGGGLLVAIGIGGALLATAPATPDDGTI